MKTLNVRQKFETQLDCFVSWQSIQINPVALQPYRVLADRAAAAGQLS